MTTPTLSAPDPAHAPPAAGRPLAVFDLDGTLLTADSFLPFLVGYGVRRRRVRALAVLPVYLALYAGRLMSDRAAKQALLVAFFRGEPAAAIAAHADRFCRTWVAKRLRAEVVERLRHHQAAGDRVILLSASPDLYVSAIARSLGIDEVIGTRVAFGGGVCDGRIDGDNCKGAAKIVAVQALLRAELPPAGSSAYGDSAHDVPLLRWVQHGFLVNAAGDSDRPLVPVAGGPGRDRPRFARILSGAVAAFGWLFCLAWAAAVAAFPLYKGRPAGYLPVAAGLAAGLALCRPGVRTALNRSVARLPTPWFLGACVAAALGLRCLAAGALPLEPVNDHSYYHRYALKLLAGEGYGGIPWPHLPHLDGGRVRAFYPPGMTFLLAGWYWLTAATPLAGKAFNIVVGTLLVVLLYDLGRRCYGPAAGRWAAALTAVFPTLVFYSASLGYEIVFAAILFGALDLAVAYRERPRPWVPPLLGALLGLGCLVKPTALLVPGLLAVWWLATLPARRALLAAAAVAAVAMLVVAPWTWRNNAVLGAPVLISTNGGYVLYSANHVGATGLHHATPPLPGEVDEVAMDRLRGSAAVEWIAGHPLQFGGLALVKGVYTWGTASTVMSFLSCDRLPAWQENLWMAVLNTAWAALLVLCLDATVRSRVWHRAGTVPAALVLAYTFAIHAVSEAESRHHIPVLPALLLVAACGMARGLSPRPPATDNLWREPSRSPR